MKNGVLLLILVIASFNSRAQVSSDTPEGIIENFFKVYEKDGEKAAVANIYAYGDSSMQQSMKYVTDTLAHTSNNLGGKCLGSELITKKCMSGSLCYYSYLVKYRLAPLRFTFVFYKPQDKWEVMNFVFDSNAINDLAKASKFENQK